MLQIAANPMSLPGWTVIIALFIGASIGSFLNVVIYRMPRGLSLGNPKHSFCPSCKSQLRVPDLIPLLSWLVLRGKCRHCGSKIPSRYFWVELLTGTLWSGIYYQYFVVGWQPAQGFAYALIGACLIAVIFIDWQFYIIPDQINAFMLLVGILFNIYLYASHDARALTWGIPSALAGALTGVITLWSIAFLGRILFRKDAMGHGDIKMARGVGAVLFPVSALVSFGLAVILGAVFGVLQLLLMRSAPREEEAEDGPEDEFDDSPESLGSLLKCLIGYVFCLDAIGLFFPKFYIAYFGENPFEAVASADTKDEKLEVGNTTIPFGPYLALGAILATVFGNELSKYLSNYWHWAGGGTVLLEHVRLIVCLLSRG